MLIQQHVDCDCMYQLLLHAVLLWLHCTQLLCYMYESLLYCGLYMHVRSRASIQHKKAKKVFSIYMYMYIIHCEAVLINNFL